MGRVAGGVSVFVLAVVFCAVLASAAQAKSSGKAWENVIIDNRTGYWRVFSYWQTPKLIDDAGRSKPLPVVFDERRHKTRAKRPLVKVQTSALPPKDWYKPTFDHKAWPRQHGTYGPGATHSTVIQGASNPTELSMLCLRGEFEAKKPEACKDLQMVVEYHGGVVVYINGQEIKRADLPWGKLKPGKTLAEAYGKDAYIKEEFKRLEPCRLRRLEVLVKPEHLKKGRNVVAIAVFRAPVHEVLDQVPDRKARVAVEVWPHAWVRRALLHSGWGLTPKSVVTSIDEPVAAKRKPGKDVLNNQTGYWRTFTRYKTVELCDDTGTVMPLPAPPKRGQKLLAGKPMPVYCTPDPPSGWSEPGFDDSEWARVRGMFGPHQAYRRTVWSPGNPAALSVLCARGTFVVRDPKACKGLAVAADYYGGVVIYINGKEVVRKELPAGKLSFDTLATAYKKPAYLKPDGKLVHPNDFKALHDHLKLYRIRSVDQVIPAAMLRQGVNVIALEVHRAPVHTEMVTGRYHRVTFMGTPDPWPHARILKIAVQTTEGKTPVGSVEPNLWRPEGVQVWNSRVVRRVLDTDYANPCETLHEVRIAGCRGGAFGGQFAFGCSDPVEEMKVTLSDLKGAGGTFPASQVEIHFLKADADSYAWGFSGRKITLWPEPPAVLQPQLKYGGSVQPIWLKARVPRDAKAGVYRGTLTINYLKGIRDINLKPQKPIEVPVKLTVHDWTLPRSQEYKTFMDIIQSPESVAMRYKVPQWSDAHFKYMEKSFQLLAEIGNKAVYLPLITRTHFGNSQSILRFVRGKDGTLTPDFTVWNKYLDLVERTQGKPLVVILYLWERYTCAPRKGPAVSAMHPLVTVVEPQTGKTSEVEVPKFNTPEGKLFWGRVLKAVRANLSKRGLEKAMMLGIHGDWTRIPAASAKFFSEVAPGLPWVDQSHGLLSGVRIDRKAWVPVGYATTVWNARGPSDPRGGRRLYGWRSAKLVCQFYRDLRRDHRSLYTYRCAAEWNITGYQRGLGRFGGDFWNVLKRGEKVVKDSRHAAGRTIIHRYPDHSSWYQLVVRTSFLGCGKDGAVPSVQFEAMREGVQNCEARIFIETALLDQALRAKLGDELAGRAQSVLDERTWVMAHASRDEAWFFDAGFTERQHKVYGVAAEVAKALAK